LAANQWDAYAKIIVAAFKGAHKKSCPATGLDRTNLSNPVSGHRQRKSFNQKSSLSILILTINPRLLQVGKLLIFQFF